MPTFRLAIALEPNSNRRVRKSGVNVSDCQDGGFTFDLRCAAAFTRTNSLSRKRRKSPSSTPNALSADSFKNMAVDSMTCSSPHHLRNLLCPGEDLAKNRQQCHLSTLTRVRCRRGLTTRTLLPLPKRRPPAKELSNSTPDTPPPHGDDCSRSSAAKA